MQNIYHIDTLDIEELPVFFVTGAGDMRGFFKFIRGKSVYRLLLPQRRHVDIPKPAYWRPANPDRWPERLPEPVTLLPHNNHTDGSSLALDLDSDEHQEGDLSRWPYPHIELGWPHEPPKSHEETEARILRAMRTINVIVKPDLRPRTNAWPHELHVESKNVEKRLRQAMRNSGKLSNFRIWDYDDFHVWSSEAHETEDVKVRWVPTKRDIADADALIQTVWGKAVTKDEWDLFRMRASMKKFTWRDISEIKRASYETVRQRYMRAVDKMFREARRGSTG